MSLMLFTPTWSSMTTEQRAEFGRRVDKAMSEHGLAYVKGLVSEQFDEAECEVAVRESVLAIGIPSSHDAGGQHLWRIAFKEEESVVPTYSQHNGVAGLHTDSQYRQHPEEAFALMTVSQATCGGGESWILHVDDIIDALLQQPGGEEHFRILSEETFPFASPSIFNLDSGNQERIEVIHAPIFEGREIRYRDDTLRRGIEASEPLSDLASKALQALEQAIHHNPKILRFHAENGTCLYIDNKRTLHGRSSFTDKNRLMLRCRFNRAT